MTHHYLAVLYSNAIICSQVEQIQDKKVTISNSDNNNSDKYCKIGQYNLLNVQLPSETP